MTLTAGDFHAFFRALHGHKPFPWQQRLVTLLAETDMWPDVLDLPTGTGKTAALDAAVFHLALGGPAQAALRIALVVDRRIVVDEAHRRARRIAEALADPATAAAEGREVVAEVARRLAAISGDPARPLVAARLRGGTPLEHDWARTPVQPTLLTSTVDQVGSRLLFRGYGVSDRMKPVHAGLLGADSLILLDEAHLSEPFRQTLRAVADLGRAQRERPAGDGDRPPLQVALLTATPGARSERPFRLEDQDRAALADRIGAVKPAVLGQAGKDEDFAASAAALMQDLRQAGAAAPAVAVVVNRIALARGIYAALAAGGDVATTLMIGRARPVDRDRIAADLAPYRTGAAERAHAPPVFIVATQCLEVGADLDLDGLVTQAAPLDALRQRFGRLNRAGQRSHARGVVLALKQDIAKKADDPVYGDRTARTWEALQRIAGGGAVDFGTEALAAALAKAEVAPAALAAPRADAPVVMPAYLDLWSQTAPPPAADPEVGLFLHGTERSAPEVALVWRGDIAGVDLERDGGPDLEALLSLVPPRTAEALSVPIWAARAWLLRPPGADDGSDGIPDLPTRIEEAAPGGGGRPVFRWAGADDPRTGVLRPKDLRRGDARSLRPGDLLVLPADYGGCDGFGWAPGSEARVRDLADRVAEPYRGRRHAVRLAPGLTGTEAWPRLAAILAGIERIDRADVQRLLAALPSAGAEDEAAAEAASALRETLHALLEPKGRLELHRPYGEGADGPLGAVIVAPRGVQDADGAEGSGRPRAPDPDARPTTEDDNLALTAPRGVCLNDHCDRVAVLARRFAATLGIAEVADLVLAARLHDAGKADPRFQTVLAGGDHWNRPDGPALAKSVRPVPREAWARAGLPQGWRHEALSVRMAPAHPAFAEARDPALVLWLIGTHHGLGRPFFSFAEKEAGPTPAPCLDTEWRLPSGPGPQSLAYDLDGQDWAALFDTLKWRYGIWGLARLEAILRLADHRASEAERQAPVATTRAA